MDEQDLMDAFASLEPMGDEAPPRHTWERHRWEMRRHVRRDPIAGFLSWPTVVATMFAGETPFICSELEALRAQPDWESRWLPAIEDSGVGNAPRMSGESSANANMIHQAFHLMMWNKATLREVADLETITEFGGGYGAMALVASRLGFRGTYRMVDFPEMLLLQTYYLSQHELGCNVEFVPSEPWVVSDTQVADLFIACYSVSEVALAERGAYVDWAAKSYLLAMQDRWNDVDNLEWWRFMRGCEIQWAGMEWSLFPMVRPGHWYAMGGMG